MKIVNLNLLRILFLILITSQFILSRRFSKTSSRKFHTHTGCVARWGNCKRRPFSYEKACCAGFTCIVQGNRKTCIQGRKVFYETCSNDAECLWYLHCRV